MIASESDRCRVVTSINRNLESRDVIWRELVIIGNVTVDGLFWSKCSIGIHCYENMNVYDKFCSTLYSFNDETFKQFGDNILAYWYYFFTIYEKLNP